MNPEGSDGSARWEGCPLNNAGGKWTCELDLTGLLFDKKVNLFYPFTTTLLEIKLNREPVVNRQTGRNKVFWFSGG